VNLANATRTAGAAALLLAFGHGPQPARQGAGAAPELVLDPVALIGRVEGDPAYMFGDIRSVAVDDSGNVYVGDRIETSVRAYSADGTYIERVAREGHGPGEITGWPSNLTFGPGGRLYTRDATRITVFAPSGRTGLADSVATDWLVPGYGNLTSQRSRVGDDGAYYYPDGAYYVDRPSRFFYQVFRAGKRTADTLEVPHYDGAEARHTAFVRLGPRDGRMVQGLSHVPFAPIPTWDVTQRGTVLSTDGASGRLLETDLHGDTVRVLTPDGVEPRRIQPGERTDSLKALEARIDSLPVTLDKVVNLGRNAADRRLPELVPAIVSLRIATGGRIWVERWPAPGTGRTRSYDVYDATGAHLASITLRAPLVTDPPPFFGRNDVVGVTTDPETGSNFVTVFELPELPSGN